MSIHISSERPVKRETASLRRLRGDYSPILIELHPGYMLLRIKKTRDAFMLDYNSAFEYAAKIAAIAVRK